MELILETIKYAAIAVLILNGIMLLIADAIIWWIMRKKDDK